MSDLPPCPKCQSALTYEDGSLLVDGFGAMALKSEFVKKA